MGYITSIAVLLILILSMAGLGLPVVNSLFNSPWGVMALLVVGIIFVHPMIQMPAITQYVHGGGPVVPGKVFPFLFITIACGALSGFHALISSGTTPKLISNERDILPIGYGAMLLDSFIAIMALIAAPFFLQLITLL